MEAPKSLGEALLVIANRNRMYEDRIKELEQQLEGIALAKGSKPLVCFKCGPVKGGHSAVYHYCHSCKDGAESAEAKLTKLREAVPLITRTINEWVHANVNLNYGLDYYPGFSQLDYVIKPIVDSALDEKP